MCMNDGGRDLAECAPSEVRGKKPRLHTTAFWRDLCTKEGVLQHPQRLQEQRKGQTLQEGKKVWLESK